MLHSLLVICLTAALFVAVVYLKRQNNDWLAPEFFWACTSLLIITVPLIFVSFQQVSVKALIWLGTCCLSIYVGNKIACQIMSKLDEKRIVLRTDYQGLAFLIILGSFVGLSSLYVQFYLLGYSIFDILHVDKFMALQRILRSDLYHPPALVAFLATGFYVASMFGGFYYAVRRETRRRYIAFLPFIPALLAAYILSTKLSFLFPLSFWVGSFFAAHVYLGRKIDRNTVLKMFWVTLGISILMLLLIIGRWMTYNTGPGAAIFGGWLGFWKYSLTLMVGHLVAFSQWFFDYIQYQPDNLGWGRYSFAGLFNYLGLSARLPMKEVIYVFPGDYQQYSLTNVYTIYRQLILDFGFAGSLFVFIMLGFISELAYRCLRAGNLGWFPILAIFYWIAMWSFNTSIFNYNSLILACCIFSTYFVALSYYKKN